MRESGEWQARRKEGLRCGGFPPSAPPSVPPPWTRYGSLVASSSPLQERDGRRGGGRE